MEYIVSLNDINDIDYYKSKNINTFIVGLKDFSINYLELSLDEIKKISNDVNLFVSINKNIFNSEIESLKEILKSLSEINIKAVMFYDISILSIVKNNNINLKLCWHQQHMVTNYNTCNYYYDKGCSYAYLANEITKDEILEIKEKTNIKLMVLLFGYPVISSSRRKLLSNYFKNINKPMKKDLYTIENNDSSLLIYENDFGTSIRYKKIINGIKPLFDFIDNDIEYGILDFTYIDKEIIDQVINIFNEAKNINCDRLMLIDKMNELVGDYTNFFYKKTIYKVKKEDK